MLRAIASAIALTLLVIGCRTEGPATSEAPASGPGSTGDTEGRGDRRKPIVVVSVGPQAYFVERLAGDLVEVQVLIPPGASHHTYEPGFEQIRAVTRADLYFRVGHPFFTFEKAWLGKLTDINPKLQIVDGSIDVPQLPGDPHTWAAPQSVAVMSRNIATALMAVLPDSRPTITANLALFLQDIQTVDNQILGAIGARRGHGFFVYHAAWGYLANAYGIKQIAIEQGSSNPDAGALARLITQARAIGIKVILIQPQMDRTSAETIAREVGGRVEVIDPLARDWLTSMRRMAELLKDALSEKPL